MILPAQHIPRDIVTPFPGRRVCRRTGASYGLSACGYDIRIKQDLWLWPIGYRLASSVERFQMPADVCGFVCDKSTLARRGIAVQNTFVEPGWEGWLTLELTNHGLLPVRIHAGQPIAQVVFARLEAATVAPYRGKYQDQPDRPVAAIREAA